MEQHPNIDHFVSELLFRHDCVIVPGLGGFVGNYAPARIHPTQHTFSPPSKLIVFNRNLQHNDGLLAQEVATACGCSFDEAMAQITAYAEDCAQRLKNGRKVELKNVGTLFFDVERNLQFEPDTTVNYLVDAFGLSAFQSMPVKRETYTERREVKTEDRTERSKPARDPKRVLRRRLVALAIATPILFAAIWLPIRADLFNGGSIADLNPFSKHEPALFKPATIKLTPTDTASYTITPATLHADSLGYDHILLTENSLPVVVQVQVPESTGVAMQAKKRSPAAVSPGAYYVIGGCFSVPANADNFLHKLEEQGFKAELLVNPKKSNLLHVSYGSFLNKADADAMLARVLADNPAAWVLHK